MKVRVRRGESPASIKIWSGPWEVVRRRSEALPDELLAMTQKSAARMWGVECGIRAWRSLLGVYCLAFIAWRSLFTGGCSSGRAGGGTHYLLPRNLGKAGHLVGHVLGSWLGLL